MHDSDHILQNSNGPTYKWKTLVTVIEILYKLSHAVCPNDPGKILVTPTIVNFYKRTVTLLTVRTEECFALENFTLYSGH